MRKAFQKFLCIISAAAITLSFSGCYFFPEEEAMLDPPVIKVENVTYSTYEAKQKTIISSTTVTGYVYSKTQTDCYFTDYTGNIKTIYAKVGDYVNEGDLLAEMNTGTLEYDLEIQKLKTQLAEFNYSASGSAADKLQLEIEQNTEAKYQAEYDGSKIIAPVSGQVSFAEKVNPGGEVNPYQVLVRIVDPDDLYVKAAAPDNSAFIINAPVTIKIGEDVFDAVISKTPTEARAEGEDDLTVLEADFVKEKPTFAYLGSLADIVLIKAMSENAVVIPKNLIKTLDGRVYVQILEDGEKKDVDVETGISNATEVEVLSGVKAGDKVIVR